MGLTWDYPCMDPDLPLLPCLAPSDKPFDVGCLVSSSEWSEVTQARALGAAAAVAAAWVIGWLAMDGRQSAVLILASGLGLGAGSGRTRVLSHRRHC